MEKTRQDILTEYERRVRVQRKLLGDLQRRLDRTSFSRLGVFIVEILLVALMIRLGYSWIFIPLLLGPVLLFLYLVKRQAGLLDDKEYAAKLLWVYENEVAIFNGEANGYDHGNAFVDDAHPYASDLDIYGRGSLFAMINRGKTEDGLSLLAVALGGFPADTGAILQRHVAVREIAEAIDSTFDFRALLQDHDPAQMRQIKDKLQHQMPAQLAFMRKSWLRPYVKVMPFVMFGLLFAAIVYGGLLWNVFGLAALLNAVVVLSVIGRVNQLYYGFGDSSKSLDRFASTIKWTETRTWKSPYIARFFAGQRSSGVSGEIKELAAIIRDFDARLNFLLAPVLSLMLLWDLRCSLRLADWYERASDDLMRGLERVGQFEELVSLATLLYNEPGWVFPELNKKFGWKGRALGHPLIAAGERVTNDFSLGAEPTVDIVTGSNMAGKSTFLRTVGTNMVLAYAGAPVCAAALSLSVFRLVSYMRIRDSLNDRTSTFKAELNRLKMILELTAEAENAFVLIDEMLRGTNSRDKFLGSGVFIEKLIAQRTQALFATHDLQLSELQERYPDAVRNYHFDIRIEAGEMEFDYQLKTGPCKTFNAALLLKQIGLSLSEA